MPEVKEGWGLPQSSRKYHYFTKDGMSLCKRYGFYFAYTEQGNDDSPENCSKCKEMLKKRTEEAP